MIKFLECLFFLSIPSLNYSEAQPINPGIPPPPPEKKLWLSTCI